MGERTPPLPLARLVDFGAGVRGKAWLIKADKESTTMSAVSAGREDCVGLHSRAMKWARVGEAK